MTELGELSGWDYTHLGQVTEFNFCGTVKAAAESLWKVPDVYDSSDGMLRSDDAMVFVDNHDNQVSLCERLQMSAQRLFNPKALN